MFGEYYENTMCEKPFNEHEFIDISHKSYEIGTDIIPTL